jgi:hypothetical protein
MIVREIERDGLKVLENFDYFNDYDDTIRWCRYNAKEFVKPLEDGYREYLKTLTLERLRRKNRSRE